MNGWMNEWMKNSNAFTLLLCRCHILPPGAPWTGHHSPTEPDLLLGSLSLWMAYQATLAQARNLGISLTTASSDTHLRIPHQILIASPPRILNPPTALYLHHLDPCPNCHHLSPDDCSRLLTGSPHGLWAPFNLPSTLWQECPLQKTNPFVLFLFLFLSLSFLNSSGAKPLGGTHQGRRPSLRSKKLPEKRLTGYNPR